MAHHATQKPIRFEPLSPRNTPLFLPKNLRLNIKKPNKNEAYLLLKKRNNLKDNYYYLSNKGNLKEAIKNLEAYHRPRRWQRLFSHFFSFHLLLSIGYYILWQ